MKKYRIAFDMDGTLCEHIRRDKPKDILYVKPYKKMVNILKKLKKEGHEIIIFTRRGILKNGRKFTKQWLEENNIPYDHLITKKPGFDILIDDRAESAFQNNWSVSMVKSKAKKIQHMIDKREFKDD